MALPKWFKWGVRLDCGRDLGSSKQRHDLKLGVTLMIASHPHISQLIQDFSVFCLAMIDGLNVKQINVLFDGPLFSLSIANCEDILTEEFITLARRHQNITLPFFIEPHPTNHIEPPPPPNLLL